ncbi:hypothetical protein [Pedobacter alpinus]
MFTVQVKAQKPEFVNQSDFGVLLGENTKGVFTVQNFSGFAFKKYKTELGVVVGFDNYQSIKIIPLAFAVKYNLNTLKKVTPYLMINTGYGFGFNKENGSSETYKGGFMFNPSVGLKFNNTGKIGYHFMVGYKTQKAVITQINDNINRFSWFIPSLTTDNYLFRKIAVTMGVSF